MKLMKSMQRFSQSWNANYKTENILDQQTHGFCWKTNIFHCVKTQPCIISTNYHSTLIRMKREKYYLLFCVHTVWNTGIDLYTENTVVLLASLNVLL